MKEWTLVDTGIEVSEFSFAHLSKAWNGERRYVVVRQEIKKRPKATGKQLSIFDDEAYGK